ARQRARAGMDRVAAGVYRPGEGELLHAALKRERIELTRALVEERRHEVGQAFLADGIAQCAEAEGEGHVQHRSGAVGDEPGGDALGALHHLHVEGGGRRRGGRGDEQQCGSQAEEFAHQDRLRHFCPSAPGAGAGGASGTSTGSPPEGSIALRATPFFSSPSRIAVTEPVLLSTWRAAAFTSSTVTLPIISGQASTSATVRPVVSATPNDIAAVRRLSCENAARSISTCFACANSSAVTPFSSSSAIAASIAFSTRSTS